MTHQPRPVWTDGDPLMEAIAAAVWEQCRTEGTSTVRDDPRNIAAVASAVITAEVHAAAHAELEDQRGAKQIAAAAADRFRDVVADCLGHADDNPGDDTLLTELRAHFGRTGPEPTGWRDRLTGYEAARDQINAAARPDDTAGA